MRELFSFRLKTAKPVLVGQDLENGRRQLIQILSGEVSGVDINGAPLHGTMLPGGIDSQIIRPNGRCDISARYGVRLDDGRTFYLENEGMRTVPAEYAKTVFDGGSAPADLCNFTTVTRFEVYDESLRWMENHVFLCKGRREPENVMIRFFICD